MYRHELSSKSIPGLISEMPAVTFVQRKEKVSRRLCISEFPTSSIELPLLPLARSDRDQREFVLSSLAVEQAAYKPASNHHLVFPHALSASEEEIYG